MEVCWAYRTLAHPNQVAVSSIPSYTQVRFYSRQTRCNQTAQEGKTYGTSLSILVYVLELDLLMVPYEYISGTRSKKIKITIVQTVSEFWISTQMRIFIGGSRSSMVWYQDIWYEYIYALLCYQPNHLIQEVVSVVK